jgi:hypothetical protein
MAREFGKKKVASSKQVEGPRLIFTVAELLSKDESSHQMTRKC